jgi:hypothetical protein
MAANNLCESMISRPTPVTPALASLTVYVLYWMTMYDNRSYKIIMKKPYIIYISVATLSVNAVSDTSPFRQMNKSEFRFIDQSILVNCQDQ